MDWGCDSIIEHILQSELTPVNVNETFEESIRSCYPETVRFVGWIFDTVSVMKDQDPTSWRIAQSEWESQEAEDGSIMSFDNGHTYYWTSDLEALLEAE